MLGAGGAVISQVRLVSGARVRLVPLEPEEARLLATPVLHSCLLLLLIACMLMMVCNIVVA